MMLDSSRLTIRALIALLTITLTLSACSSEEEEVDDPDVGTDVGDVDDSDVDVGPPPEGPVPLELDPFVQDAPDPGGYAEAFEVTDEAELIEGTAATGRVGDYVLQNDRVRFVVQQDARTIGACPWGGNVIDAEYLSDGFGGDILGELCLFLNADQTFKPEEYEIIEDGTNGAAVLAITGTTAILDFLNVEAMIADMDPAMVDLFHLKPDDLMPLTITKYYVLRPGDVGVRTLTMLRNDGDEKLHIIASHLFVGGADGEYFNPIGEMGGYGYVDRGLADTNPDTLPFLAMLSDSAGVAYMPRPDERLSDDLPISGAYLVLFNVAASVLGRTNIINTLLANEQQLSSMEGILHIEPRDVDMIEHWTWASDDSPSTMIDYIYPELGVDTGRVEGTVVDDAGEPVDGILVSAVDDQGYTMNQTRTGSDGSYSMALPTGNYELSARDDAQFTIDTVAATVTSGDTTGVDDITTEPAGTVHVSVTTPDGDPTPARVTLLCDGPCPNKATSNERDVTFDGLPEEFATIEWVGVTGELEFTIPEGDYEVVVSRGMEWSTWPTDAHLNGGHPLEVTPGQPASIDAEIARVVDTSGALSGDFHVHALSSLDSTTPKQDRVLSFLTEGVDVIVSSDHDVIADWGPAVEALGAQDHMATIVGSEITTIDLGHFNGFPLLLDEHHRRGGALDWAGGLDDGLSPAAIYEWIDSHPDEQVVQINHPDSSYFRFSDVLRGISYGDVERMRVQTPDYDEATGDTGLWNEEFTAMELMNGPRMDRFWGVARWWLTLVGRGHLATGTAVTDTHQRFGRGLGGVPRTFVFVGDGFDDPGAFDQPHFVSSVNAQRAIGTNGPFVRVHAENDSGDTASFGETLETNGDSVTFSLTIEVPEWIHVDRIEMIMNSEDVITDPGEYNTDPIEPTETFDIELTEDHLEVVGGENDEHRRYRKIVDIDIDTDVDSYVVFFVHGSEAMAPIVPDEEILPFAFTNPVYLDVDGTGYSNPPLAELAASDPPAGNPMMILHGGEVRDLSELTPREILDYIEEKFPHGHSLCDHDGHHHHHGHDHHHHHHHH